MVLAGFKPLEKGGSRCRIGKARLEFFLGASYWTLDAMFDFLWSYLSHDLAIDLGTANTLVHVRGKGIVIREPSVVARHKKTKKILAIGTEAKKMMGKTPMTIEAFRPLKDGVIADFDATEAMLTHFIRQVHEVPGSVIPRIPKPRVVIGIPGMVTEVERRAVQHAAISAGARKAYLIEEAMAAAIGARLPIHTSMGSMIVDVGGGTTEVAVVSLGGIVVNRSIRVGGDEMDEAIAGFLRLKYSLLVGISTAERIKIEIGSARQKAGKESPAERHAVVRGRDLETGLPKSVRLTESEIREALSPVVAEITEAIAEVAQETPPELVPDILESGIAVTGGGSLLAGLEDAISERTKFPVWQVENPLTTVVRGCAYLLENERLLEKVKVSGGLRK